MAWVVLERDEGKKSTAAAAVRLVVGGLLAVGPLACGDSPEPGDSETTGSAESSSGSGSGSEHPETSSAATTAEATIASSEESGASETRGEPLDCTARNPDFECAPMDCEHPIYQFQCGSIEVDDDGCFRPWCLAQDDCPIGLSCYKLAECDPEASGCTGLGGCGMIGDECTCTAVGGCQYDPPPPIEEQRGYCIPSELRPC